MTTEKQKAAVKFCEQWLHVEYKGDINDFNAVSKFLGQYLDEAKSLYFEAKYEYEAYIAELD